MKIIPILAILLCDLFMSSSANQKPHIIFILVDDMGWNDVGFHGMTDVPTPNIDALAANSVILNNYYTYPICTPSRAALMTGMYPSKIGMNHIIILPGSPWGLPLEIPTMANHFNKIGYTSRIIGKWHLGDHRTEYTPLRRGFHSHFGFWHGAVDYATHKFEWFVRRERLINVPQNVTDEKILFSGRVLRDDMEEVCYDGQYLTDILTERAVKIIHNHEKSKPLFMYLSHHAPHRSNQFKLVDPPAKYTHNLSHIVDKNRSRFAGHLTALDASVGKVMEALASANMLQDSIVVFSTDNGADVFTYPNGGSNFPLRGQKISAFEGGVRAVGMVWSPKLPNERRGIWNGMAHIVDWLPTLYGAAGGNPEDLVNIDGVNLWPAISQNHTSPRNEMLLYLDPIWKLKAIRVGNYKLTSGSPVVGDETGWEPNKGYNRNTIKNQTDLLWKSDTFKALMTLQGIGSLSTWIDPIRVSCGPRIEKPEFICKPKSEPCLFDIAKDPCEFANIAKENPLMVKTLSDALKVYEKSAVTPLNKGIFDYLVNPILHKGYFVPWLDDDIVRNLGNNSFNCILTMTSCVVAAIFTLQF